MRKVIILLLAMATSAIAFLEDQTIGFPQLGQTGLDFMLLYIPAAIVVVMTAALIFLRFPLKDVCWSLLAGTVTTISSYIWASLTVCVCAYIDMQAISDIHLFLMVFLMIAYVLAIPAFALGIYFYSLGDVLKKIALS